MKIGILLRIVKFKRQFIDCYIVLAIGSMGNVKFRPIANEILYEACSLAAFLRDCFGVQALWKDGGGSESIILIV